LTTVKTFLAGRLWGQNSVLPLFFSVEARFSKEKKSTLSSYGNIFQKIYIPHGIFSSIIILSQNHSSKRTVESPNNCIYKKKLNFLI